MPRFLEEKVDIFKLPTRDPIYGAYNSEITIGDLHGNAMKLMFMLVKHGIARSLTEEDYEKLVEIYKKDASDLGKNDLTEFNNILSKIDFNPTIGVRLIGDELADRGSNDYFTLKILEKLSQHGVPFEILVSNHSLEFLRVMESEKDRKYSSILGPSQATSLYNLGNLITRSLITEDEIIEINDFAYKPSLKALSYTLSEDYLKITLFSHAPIGLNNIEALAKEFEVTYHNQTAKQLAVTIDEINKKFSALVDENKVNTKNLKNNPLYPLIWNRDYYSIKRPNSQYNYQIYYTHGHDPFGPTRANYFNLDGMLGKNKNGNKGTYTIVQDSFNRITSAPLLDEVANDERLVVDEPDQATINGIKNGAQLARIIEYLPEERRLNVAITHADKIKNVPQLRMVFQSLPSEQITSLALHIYKGNYYDSIMQFYRSEADQFSLIWYYNEYLPSKEKLLFDALPDVSYRMQFAQILLKEDLNRLSAILKLSSKDEEILFTQHIINNQETFGITAKDLILSLPDDMNFLCSKELDFNNFLGKICEKDREAIIHALPAYKHPVRNVFFNEKFKRVPYCNERSQPNQKAALSSSQPSSPNSAKNESALLKATAIPTMDSQPQGEINSNPVSQPLQSPKGITVLKGMGIASIALIGMALIATGVFAFLGIGLCAAAAILALPAVAKRHENSSSTVASAQLDDARQSTNNDHPNDASLQSPAPSVSPGLSNLGRRAISHTNQTHVNAMAEEASMNDNDLTQTRAVDEGTVDEHRHHPRV